MSVPENVTSRYASLSGRRMFTLLPLAVFLTLAGVFLVRLFAGDPSRVPSALIGKPVPAFDLPAVDGLSKNGAAIPGLSTTDLRGGVTVVNVWASWCVPCRDENPMLLDLEARGYRVVGINYKDRATNARRFLTEFGNPFAAVGVDRKGRAAIDWGVYGVPETFVVNADGKIVHKHVGPFSKDDLEKTIVPAIMNAGQGATE